MNFYKISCHSDCGSYFSSYLQDVSVIAPDEDTAKNLVCEWLIAQGNTFIKDQKHWAIENLGQAKQGVIDHTYNSDY